MLGVDPAPAGMLRTASSWKAASSSRPRARGDAPLALTAAQSRGLSTPRPRGCSGSGQAWAVGQGVDPAPAGMLRPAGMWTCPRSCRPRARGDAPPTQTAPPALGASTPRPRGCSAGRRPPDDDGEVDPAPAGMLRPHDRRAGGDRRRPRARGDAPRFRYRHKDQTESTPRPRGCSVWICGHRGGRGVDPAPAGMLPRPTP